MKKLIYVFVFLSLWGLSTIENPLSAQCWSEYDSPLTIIGPTSCINALDSAIYEYSVVVPEDLQNEIMNFSWNIGGDIKRVDTGGNPYKISVMSTGKGVAKISIRHKMARDTLNTCCKLGCISYSYAAYIDLFKIYTPDAIIEGDKLIRRGNVYIYTAVNTGNTDQLSWQFPPYLEYKMGNDKLRTYYANDKPSKKDSIRLFVGRCNTNTPIILELIGGTKKPEIAHEDSLKCLSKETNEISIEVLNPDSSYTYWWGANSYSWNIRSLNERNTKVIIQTAGEAGVLRLYATNELKVDTAFSEYEVTRQFSDNYQIEMQENCFEKNQSAKMYLYPSPGTKVLWHFPSGWQSDRLNENSSSIYPQATDSAVSGYITVQTLSCGQVLDSVYVYMKGIYDTTQGINIEYAECKGVGDTVSFVIKPDYGAQKYIWEFPEDWVPNRIESSNPLDSVVYVQLGNTKGLIKVRGYNCSGEWSMSNTVSRFKPNIPIFIPFSDTFCINTNMADTVQLTVSAKDTSITDYLWTLPPTWEPLGATNDSSITVVTDGVYGEYPFSVKTLNLQCGESLHALEDTVEVKGVDLDMRISILPARVPANSVSVKLLPLLSLDKYEVEWYFDNLSNKQRFTNITFTDLRKPNPVYIAVLKRKGFGCKSAYSNVAITPVGGMVSESSLSTRKNITPNTTNTLSNTNSDLSQNIKIYPNPTKKEVNVSLSGVEGYDMQLFSMNGKMLEYRNIRGLDSFVMDMSKYTKGMYILAIYDASGNKYTQKIEVVK